MDVGHQRCRMRKRNWRQSQVSVIAIVLVIFVLAAINYTFFAFTKDALLNEQIENMDLITSNIEIVIKLMKNGEQYVWRMQVVPLITSLIALIILQFVFKYYKRNKEEAERSAQEGFVENIEQLFVSIKEQRHDFNNHIATIHSLVATKQYDELQKYTGELVGEIATLNDIININSPVLCALIQAKRTQAFDRKIRFEHDIINMKNIQLTAVKNTDLVKVLSNLIDNAFEAVEALDETERYVLLEVYREGNYICFSVYNKGTPIQESKAEKIFEKGYSSKKDSGQHSGMGLYIVQKMIKKYKGTITLISKRDGNTFKVMLPL